MSRARRAPWGEFSRDEVMAAALVERFVHHCHSVDIRRNSYLLWQHAELARRCTADRYLVRRHHPSSPPTEGNARVAEVSGDQ